MRTISSSQGNRIVMDGKLVINMASNNYLGMANHPEVIAAAKAALDTYGIGPGAGRTIAGNYPVHNELEAALAHYKHTEDAIVFNSGFTANLGVIPSLVGKDDVIFSDELNHASIIDACRLSKAQIKPYKHLDMQSLRLLLEETTAQKKLIVSDGVFSMDGDLAPLPQIYELAKKHNALIMVDDAHGDGVMGAHGRGVVEHFGMHGLIDVESGSLSKAFGTAGGFVAGKKELIEYMRKHARSFIFTSSPLPQSYAAATLRSLQILMNDETRLHGLWHNRAYFSSRIKEAGFDIGNTQSPIIPVYIGDETLSATVSQRLFEEGVFAQSIQYPFVAAGRARIRVILSSTHTTEDLNEAVKAFVRVGQELAIIK